MSFSHSVNMSIKYCKAKFPVRFTIMGCIFLLVALLILILFGFLPMPAEAESMMNPMNSGGEDRSPVIKDNGTVWTSVSNESGYYGTGIEEYNSTRSRPEVEPSPSSSADIIILNEDHDFIDSSTGNNSGVSSGANVTITQIDYSLFPTIKNYVTVTDAVGNHITGLTEADFSVREDGVNQQFTVLERTGAATNITVALVIDTSGSMSGQRMTDAKDAAKGFISELQPGDRAAVIEFNFSSKVVQGFTGDKDLLIQAVDSLVASGATALYQSIIDTSALLLNEFGTKSMIVLADGDNNRSPSDINLPIAAANNAGVSVYSIGFHISEGSSAEKTLQEISDSTGGRYYRGVTADELSSIYNEIAGTLRNHYEITYTTNNPVRDGTERLVRIGYSGVFNERIYIAPDEEAPPAPTLIAPPDSSNVDGDVTFSWEPVARAVNYQLKVEKVSSGETALLENTVETSLSHTFPVDGTEYRWTVIARGSGGWGPPSEAWTFISGKADNYIPAIYWINTSNGTCLFWDMDVNEDLDKYERTGGETVGVFGIDWVVAGIYDMNGNGHPDIIWENRVDPRGQVLISYMEGSKVVGWEGVGWFGPVWEVVGVADVIGNGRPDIIWQNTQTGLVIISRMEGSKVTRWEGIGVFPIDWRISTAIDLTGNGFPELIWENIEDGRRIASVMIQTTIVRWHDIGQWSSSWQIVAAGDINGDGNNELIWENTVTGVRRISFMNVFVVIRWLEIQTVPIEWRIVGFQRRIVVPVSTPNFEATSININPAAIREEMMPYYPDPDTLASILVDVTEEGSFEVSYTITNTGNARATQDVITNAIVSFDFGLTAHMVGGMFATSVTLEAGESRTIRRTFNGTAGGLWTFILETDNDEVVYMIYVDESVSTGANFAVSFFQIPSEVKATKDYTIRFSVENTGGAAGNQRVKLYEDGNHIAYVDVSLDPGESKNYYITLTATKDVGYAYSYIVESTESSASITVDVIPIVRIAIVDAPWVPPTSPHQNFNNYNSWSPFSSKDVPYKTALNITAYGDVPFAKVIFDVRLGVVEIHGYDDGNWAPGFPYSATWVPGLEDSGWWPPWAYTTPPTPEGFQVDSNFNKTIPLVFITRQFGTDSKAIVVPYVVDANTPYPYQIISN